MMGERTVMQEALFYSFSLERHVPDDHLLRRIGTRSSTSLIWSPSGLPVHGRLTPGDRLIIQRCC